MRHRVIVEVEWLKILINKELMEIPQQHSKDEIFRSLDQMKNFNELDY